MRKITFVCTGNTCRSVMAQQMLRNALRREGINNVEVDSAGTAVYPGYAIIGDLKAVMDEKKVEYSGHSPRMIDQEIIDDTELILAATSAHVEEIKSRFNVPRGKVRLLSAYAAGEINDIEDPIGCGKGAYERVYEHIDKYIEKITEMLKNET